MSIIQAQGQPPVGPESGTFFNPQLQQIANNLQPQPGPQGYTLGGYGVGQGNIGQLMHYYRNIYWTETFEQYDAQTRDPDMPGEGFIESSTPDAPGPGDPGYGVVADADGDDPPSSMLDAYAQQIEEGPDAISKDMRRRNFETARERERQKLRDYAKKVYETDNPSPAQMAELWEWGVSQMQAANSMGLDPMNPWHWIQERHGSIAGERDSAAKERERLQKTINLTDPETARALVKQLFRSVLDKAPTDEDVAQFVDALNGFERDNPQVTRTTVTTDEEGNKVTEDQVVEGGADPTAFAENWLEEEFGDEIEVQRIGGEWYDAVISAIGSPA